MQPWRIIALSSRENDTNAGKQQAKVEFYLQGVAVAFACVAKEA